MTEPTSQTDTSANPAPVPVPEAAIASAYSWAIEHARIRARGGSEVEDELTDAATSAVLWAIERCTNPATFENFAKSAVRRWVARQLYRIARKRRNRRSAADADEDGRVEDLRARVAKPTRPTMNDALPDELAFTVSLYLEHGFSMYEIGLLTGVAKNTVMLRLKRAAVLLHDGPIVDRPSRRNGEKRLIAG